MNETQSQLTSVLKAAQMGQIGIRCVRQSAVPLALREELATQLREYDAIEKEALSLAARRDWPLHDLNPIVRRFCSVSARMRLRCGSPSSQIAGMMIQGNTRGMITSIKNLRRYHGHDPAVEQLSRKLLHTETCNIQQMKKFL